MTPSLQHRLRTPTACRADGAARHRAALTLCAIGALLGGCTVPAPAPVGLADVIERPAERALFEGIRDYDDGQYAPAETALRRALAAGLRSPRDQAGAHKLLAFITCTSDRLAECRAEFGAALAADPAFSLSRAEAGHPVWGPVYRQVVPRADAALPR